MSELEQRSQPAPSRFPKLLVSVQNVTEAAVAREAGVGWIDLKSPDNGSLGAPSMAIAEEVSCFLQDFSNRSVALGELSDFVSSQPRDNTLDSLRTITSGFPIAKIGLAGCAQRETWASDWLSLATLLDDVRLVPVVYADEDRSLAPKADKILELACDAKSPYLLIDTFTKEKERLLDFWPLPKLSQFCESAYSSGISVVVAGSLREIDLPSILPLPIGAVAVRGAVCQRDRASSLCPEKLQRWVSKFTYTSPK